MNLFVEILALVSNLSVRRPARTESSSYFARVLLKRDPDVDEYSALYNLYATGELTPEHYWHAKKALLDREATRHILHS